MLPPAPLNKRAIAFVMDMFIVITCVFTVWVVLSVLVTPFFPLMDWVLTGIVGHQASIAIIKGLFTVFSILMAVVFPVAVFGYYFARMESSTVQASIGKMFMNLRVVDEEGNRLDDRKAWWRSMNKLLSMLILGGGFVPAFLNPEHQTMHDKMSRTLVIMKP